MIRKQEPTARLRAEAVRPMLMRFLIGAMVGLLSAVAVTVTVISLFASCVEQRTTFAPCGATPYGVVLPSPLEGDPFAPGRAAPRPTPGVGHE